MSQFADIIKNLNKKPPRERNDHVLIIDSLNTFMRNFVTVKTMNNKAQHVGGLVGFLRSLALLIRISNPTRVICVFDGLGGASARKNMNSNYKSQRNLTRITKWGMYEDLKEEQESMTAQISRLFEYLETLPVEVVIEPKVEADDVIAFLAEGFSRRAQKVTVVSTDRDFFQILKGNIELYNPVSKITYTQTNAKDLISTNPENYLIMKALIGDNSDNLRGVQGLGAKSLVKYFPIINEQKISLQDIYDTAERSLGTKKVYARVIDDWERVKSNYNIMNLQDYMLDEDQKRSIVEQLRNNTMQLNIGAFLHLLEQDKIEGITINTDSWLYEFKYLSALS